MKVKCICVMLLASIVPALPQAKKAPPALVQELVLANHILANEGVVDAYGHVSVRDPNN